LGWASRLRAIRVRRQWKAFREENRQQVPNKGHERQQKRPTRLRNSPQPDQVTDRAGKDLNPSVGLAVSRKTQSLSAQPSAVKRVPGRQRLVKHAVAIGLKESLDLIGAIWLLTQMRELLLEGLATRMTVAGFDTVE